MNKLRPRPLLLLGAYGRGNLGDDIFLLCAVAVFENRHIYINSAHNFLLPAQVQSRVHTMSTVRTFDIHKKIMVFLKVKEASYWGGDFWVELYGTRFPRALLYKMIALNLLFRCSGKRVNYIGCGIGDLTGYSLWLARISARLANTVTVRERRSAQVLGLKKVVLVPDIAVNLPYNLPHLHEANKSKPFKVVISVLWGIPDAENTFESYINHIASSVKNIQRDDIEIVILAMHVTDLEENDDVFAARQLQNRLKGYNVVICQDRSLESVTELLRNAHLVIGTRLHACILAILNGTPTIGISYRPKVGSFFTEANLGEYYLDVESTEILSQKVEHLINGYDHAANKFYESALNYNKRKTEYEDLVKIL